MSGTKGDDAQFVTLWTGHRAGIVGFRLVFWAMDDAFAGLVERTAAALASHNAKDWVPVTLDPAPATSWSIGLHPVSPRHRLVDQRHLPHLRIGVMVQRRTTPTGSAVQTVEGRVTLIGEAV